MNNNTDSNICVGMVVQTWGIVGGSLPGRVIAKAESKDCWKVRVRTRFGGTAVVTVNEDYLIPKTRKR